MKQTLMVLVDLRVGNISIPSELHILSNDFPIWVDGILGKDFVRRHGWIFGFQGVVEDRLFCKALSIPYDISLTLLNISNIN